MDTDSAEHAAGQTFQCPHDGELDTIQVYSISVPHPGRVILTLHQFDRESRYWGPALTSSEIEVDKKDVEHWVRFDFPSVPLHKNNTYGFRLKSPDALVGIGEAAWPSRSPFAYGEEWHVDDYHNKELYYQYFSLAFKVELSY